MPEDIAIILSKSDFDHYKRYRIISAHGKEDIILDENLSFYQFFGELGYYKKI